MHPTIGAHEVVLLIAACIGFGVQVMNLWDGLADYRDAKKGQDSTLQHAAGIAVRSDGALLMWDMGIIFALIRALYRAETLNSTAGVALNIVFSCIVAFSAWVSVKNRNARWQILRPPDLPVKESVLP